MATKKKAGSKAKAKARKTARTRMDQPYDYVVKVVEGRVVIEGVNDGNIYGRHKQSVTFSADTDVPPFTFSATDFVRNDSKKRKKLGKRWPFKGAEPAWPQPTFSGRLKSPGLFKRAFYKYTIAIDGAIAADPIIIIER
jgi:hypothetical protein